MEVFFDCKKTEFIFNERKVILVEPNKVADSAPWIWRTEFFGAFPYADVALLKMGWHIVYYKVSDMYGCPESIELMKDFHDEIIKMYNLSNKAVLFGFSRGGLYAANYSMKYPQDVRSIYLDAPVLDVLSWPGGFYDGIGGEKEWEECKACYNISDDSAKDFCKSPIDRIDELIKTNIPVILVAGDCDDVVPYHENGQKMKTAYEKAGAYIKEIVKPGIGHHPHSLEDPTEIVDFIKRV